MADGYHLWSETYDRRLADVFAVQDEISRAIVAALEVRVAGNPGRRLVQSSTQDLEAYNLYLQGRFHLNKWRPEGARKGSEYFGQAIAKDPGYAPAYTGMADCYTWLAVFGWNAARQAMPQARQAANRALQLDETPAAAHVSLGYVKALYDWDWPGAEREFKRALQLSPGDADARTAWRISLPWGGWMRRWRRSSARWFWIRFRRTRLQGLGRFIVTGANTIRPWSGTEKPSNWTPPSISLTTRCAAQKP